MAYSISFMYACGLSGFAHIYYSIIYMNQKGFYFLFQFLKIEPNLLMLN